MYVTGGIGATGGNEGFAGPYVLPNMTAYCETCASIGNIFTNHRLFLLHGEAKYIDILEKTLYNSMLSGVSLSADRFFYPNPLESEGQHKRSEWFGCACCPSNIARFIPAIPGYIYAADNDGLYINLYASNEAEVMISGTRTVIEQKAGFPWRGDVDITLSPDKPSRFTVRLRIPGWARNEAMPGDLYLYTSNSEEEVSVTVNGDLIDEKPVGGYIAVEREWKKGDRIGINLPMPVRTVAADERIEEDRDKLAFQRGPVIFCAEWPDNNTGNVLNLFVDPSEPVSTEFVPDLLGGTQVIRTYGNQTKKAGDGSNEVLEKEPVTLIPYALWNNRGPGQMMVWIPSAPERT